jgi:hypothetical protein
MEPQMKLNKNLALSESGFAFNGSTGDTFLLNETAIFLVQKIKDGFSFEQLLNSLLEHYDVNPIEVEKDLLDFLKQLRLFNLLED